MQDEAAIGEIEHVPRIMDSQIGRITREHRGVAEPRKLATALLAAVETSGV